jgi:ribose transport system substrate-binding protein
VNRNQVRHALVVLFALLALVVAVGCGDDDDSGGDSGGSPPADSSGGGDGGELAAQAKEVIAKGADTPLYTTVPEADMTLDDIEASTEWHGPTEAPAPQRGKHLTVIPIVAAGAPLESSEAIASAAKALGWTTKMIDAKGTPAGMQQAFQAALSSTTDAIITIAIPASVVGDSLEAAKKAKIPTIGLSSDPEDIPTNYDAYLPSNETFSAKLEAWYAIADSGGDAKVALIWDTGYPSLQHALEGAEQVLDTCEDCEVLDTVKVPTTTTADPVKYQQAINSILAKDSDVEYILTPYGLNLQAAAEAVAASGKPTKVLTKNAEVASLKLISEDKAAFDSGVQNEWIGWASVDQANRLLNGEPPLENEEIGLPVQTFEKTNAPGDGIWESPVDFESEYRKIWGL